MRSRLSARRLETLGHERLGHYRQLVESMMTFPGRAWLATTVTVIVAILLATFLWARSILLLDTAFMSGFILAGITLFLALYNVRKKITYPPLIRSSTWLQFHVYVGYLSIFIFLFHIGFRIPNGALEGTLAVLFVSVALSGIIGLFLSRIVPRRLSVRGEGRSFGSIH